MDPITSTPVTDQGVTPAVTATTPDNSTVKPIIMANKVTNVVARAFVNAYLQENGNNYQDALNQLLTIDEMVENGSMTEADLLANNNNSTLAV